MKKMLVSLLAAGLLAALLAGCGTQTPAAVPEPEPETETPAETVEATEPEEPAAEEEPESEPEPAKPTVPYLGDVPIFIGCTVSEATEILGTTYQKDYEEGGTCLIFENEGITLALDDDYSYSTLSGDEEIICQTVWEDKSLFGGLSSLATLQSVSSYQASRGQTMDPLTEDGNFFAYDSWVSDPSGKYAIEFQYESVGADTPAVCSIIYSNWGLEKPSMSKYIGEWTCTNFDSPVDLTIHSMDSNSITFDVLWVRLWGIDTVTLPMQNGVATFSDQDMLSGTIIVKNGFVQLKITASDMEYIPTQTFYFAMCGV